MKEMISINRSWLTGNYRDVAGYNVSIFSAFDTVSIEDPEDERVAFFWDGTEGAEIIDTMTALWLTGNITQTDAVLQWMQMFLI